MSNLTKKFVVGLLAFAMIFTAFAGVFAQEEDVDDEIAEIEAIADELGLDSEALLEGLNTDTEEETTEEEPSFGGIPQDFRFEETLSQGAEGDVVQYLQILLNTNPDTKVAEDGAPGSPGNETEYFGPATHEAVVNFHQEVLGLDVDHGIVGPQTRAELNSMLESGETEEQAEEGEETEEVTMDQVLSQLQQLASALESLQSRLNEVEEKAQDGGAESTDIDGDTEGSFALSASPDIYSQDITPDKADQSVAEFEVEAEDSNMVIQRLDLDFVDDNFDEDRMRDVFNYVSLYHDGEELGRVEVTRDNVEENSSNEPYVRFSGLDLQVSEDSTKDLVVKVDSADFEADDLEGSSAQDVDVQVASEGLRGLDSAGITQYNDDQPTRSFTLDPDADLAELEFDLNDNSPEEDGIIEVEESDLAEDKTLAIYDVEVTEGNVELTDADIQFDSNTSKTLDDVIARASLFVDGTFVEEKTSFSEGDTSEVLSFEIDDYEVAEGETAELDVVVDLYGMGDSINWEGVEVSSTLNSVDYYDVAEDEDYTTATDDGSDKLSAEEGEVQYLLTAIPGLTLNDQAMNLSDSSSADDAVGNGYLDFTLEAARKDLTPNYVKFNNTGSGLFTLPVAEVDETEIEAIPAVDAQETDFGAGSLSNRDVVYLENQNGVYRVTSDDQSEADGTNYDHVMDLYYESNVEGVDVTSTEEGEYMFTDDTDVTSGIYRIDTVDDGSSTVTEMTLVYALDSMDKLDNGLAFGDDLDTELTEGDDMDIMLEARVKGADSRERLKVYEIGWTESEAGRKALMTDEFDAVDALETDREFTNYAISEYKDYYLTLAANDDNYGSVSGSGWYNNNDTADIDATPTGDFVFGVWDPATYITSEATANTDLTMPATDHTATAQFFKIAFESTTITDTDSNGDVTINAVGDTFAREDTTDWTVVHDGGSLTTVDSVTLSNTDSTATLNLSGGTANTDDTLTISASAEAFTNSQNGSNEVVVTID